MKRGDIIVVAAQGDYGKPRPAVVVQSDSVTDLESISVAPITTTLTTRDMIRPAIEPTAANGLRGRSQVMIDKIQPIRRSKIGAVIGSFDAETMEQVSRAIGTFFGLADSRESE